MLSCLPSANIPRVMNYSTTVKLVCLQDGAEDQATYAGDLSPDLKVGAVFEVLGYDTTVNTLEVDVDWCYVGLVPIEVASRTEFDDLVYRMQSSSSEWYLEAVTTREC